jgi:hypothetical protein
MMIIGCDLHTRYQAGGPDHRCLLTCLAKTETWGTRHDGAGTPSFLGWAVPEELRLDRAQKKIPSELLRC